MQYCIIIPIFNEIDKISRLLKALKPYALDNNEIIIVDDGSSDGSEKVLESCSFIYHIRFKYNIGKGTAIQTGLKHSKSNKIIIFDGDLEVDPKDIRKLMVLDVKKNIRCVFGIRNRKKFPFSSLWDIGNYVFTTIFNIINFSNQKDVLCCAKAFFKEDINISELSEPKFGIDIELLSILLKKQKNIQNVKINYNRRSYKEGKKIKIKDGIDLIKTMIRLI